MASGAVCPRKTSGHVADHPPPSSAGVKDEWSYISAAFGGVCVCAREHRHLFFIFKTLICALNFIKLSLYSKPHDTPAVLLFQ
jgi:hypothetical protein